MRAHAKSSQVNNPLFHAWTALVKKSKFHFSIVHNVVVVVAAILSPARPVLAHLDLWYASSQKPGQKRKRRMIGRSINQPSSSLVSLRVPRLGNPFCSHQIRKPTANKTTKRMMIMIAMTRFRCMAVLCLFELCYTVCIKCSQAQKGLIVCRSCCLGFGDGWWVLVEDSSQMGWLRNNPMVILCFQIVISESDVVM